MQVSYFCLSFDSVQVSYFCNVIYVCVCVCVFDSFYNDELRKSVKIVTVCEGNVFLNGFDSVSVRYQF